jgi:DNA topoisomerase-1
MDAATMDLDRALALLALPRDVGPHPETGEMISAGLGRFGPYIRYAGNYISLKEDDVLSIGLNRAVALIADAPKKAPAKTVGDHPKDGKPITLKAGRFGPYVQHGTIRATLPKGLESDDVTVEKAVELLDAKAARAKGGKTTKAATKSSETTAEKKPAKKAAAKKTTKKTATKKTAAKKKTPAKTSGDDS